MDLDTSLESMLQHARVALGRRATPHGTPPRQQPGAGRTSRRHPLAAAPMMPSATDDAAVRELLETSDVDRWLATAHPDRKSTHDATRDRKAPLAPSRCMSPSRQVLVAAGHDKHVLPSFVSTHAVNAVGTVAPGSSHTRIASNAITAPAVVRQGTLDDVLSNVVVRHHLPMRIEPYARDHNSNHRSSIAGHGYSVGDRVSGFLNDQPNRASGVWGPNGELAIGFDDNDNPVVVVRSSSSGIHEAADDALSSNNALSRKPAATAGATSKVSSVQSQALSSFEAPPPHLVLPMPPEPPCLEVPLAGSINKSPTLSTGGGGKPLPTPTDGSSFKDVQFHFITPNLLSNTTSPPLACEPLAASTAGKPEDVAASDKLAKSSGRETAVTPVELVGTAPPSLIAPRLPPSPSHRQLDVQAAAGSKRTSVPQDTSTQTERVQPSPTDPQPAPPSVAPPPSVDETKPNISCPDHGQQLNVWEQLNPTAAGGQRALPVLRIPSEDDGIVFVGPYMRMDDRDPSFVSAMSQRDDRRSGVIPPLEFRRLIVGDGGGVASGTAAAAAPIIQDHAAAAAVKGSRVVPAPTSRSQSLNTGGASAPPIEPSAAAAAGGPAATGKPPVTIPLRTYHAFHEEFPPPPPPPPPKASTSRCWCC